MCHLFPMIYFLIELLINKIRFPAKHIAYTLGIIIFYLSSTLLYQKTGLGQENSIGLPIYFSNLNFNCEHNFFFLYNDVTDFRKVDQNYSQLDGSCGQYYNNRTKVNVTVEGGVVVEKDLKKKGCSPILQFYYC